MACPTCGLLWETVERASGGYVEILVAPSPEGNLYRLQRGADAGKYLKIEGPLLDRLRSVGARLHTEHACTKDNDG